MPARPIRSRTISAEMNTVHATVSVLLPNQGMFAMPKLIR